MDFFYEYPMIFQKTAQLSHKKQPTAAHCGQSRALLHTLSRRSLVRRRMHPPTGNRQFRAQLFKAGKSDKITFSKIKFFTIKNRGNTCFLINYGISVKKFLIASEILLLQAFNSRKHFFLWCFGLIERYCQCC